MAKHSLGGLRSLETVDAGDRTITRLSPIQTWIIKHALDCMGRVIDGDHAWPCTTLQGSKDRGWASIPPQSNVRLAARRLTMRGLLEMRGDMVRYLPLRGPGSHFREVVLTNGVSGV